MDVNKLAQWNEILKNYHSEKFWEDVFGEEIKLARPYNPEQHDQACLFYQNELFPRCDLYEESGTLFIEAELPGIQKEEIELKIENNSLTMKGVCRTLKPKRQYFLKERQNRTFEKKILLPVEIAVDKMAAHLENGVLKISLPVERNENEAIYIQPE
ncbi:hypothetical protein CU633_05230 [Bacillus sp. V3-13]|uniref:Hsp20/alpha crystallin family protein n=1 Tax=Bacillus sp. V3-13 TaxID=2053728 RepID=UPI000C78A55A|nr:Hsp20/alpha crystallin family protein [Bacillus sp. V3-13]PLR78386.1 hypothetical protein CU633_05230 [Bacillus sp. V3-13]